MSRAHNVFAGAYVNRAAHDRADARSLGRALADPATRFVAVTPGHCLADAELGRLVLLERRELPPNVGIEQMTFLGIASETMLFAIELDASAEHPDAQMIDLRTLGALLNPVEANIVAQACALTHWQRSQAYCGACGSPVVIEAGGYAGTCENQDCAQRSFPRVDPAIIVLVSRDDQCLLGRQASWPEGRYSTIAGFVEPGESLEDAVAREVHEESNIRVTDIRYQSSQPWPFPASLMLGFYARASSGDIRMNDGELEDVRWFDRDELANGSIRLSPGHSIARRLIDDWLSAS